MEGFEDQGAAVADSPAADVPTADTPPGAQSGVTGQPSVAKDPPFHQHPRFQQLIGENRSLKGELATLKQTVDGLQRTASQPARTEEQRQARTEAIKALKELMAEDPELAEVLSMRKEFPQLKQGYQGVGQIAKAQQDAATRQGRAQITTLAEQAGLSTDAKYVGRIERLIAAEIFEDKDALERYQGGDLSVINEKFKLVTDEFLGQTRRAAQTTVIDTKNKTRQLPPVSRGGAPGADAPPTLKAEDRGNPDKVRAFERGLGETAKRLLQSRGGG